MSWLVNILEGSREAQTSASSMVEIPRLLPFQLSRGEWLKHQQPIGNGAGPEWWLRCCEQIGLSLLTNLNVTPIAPIAYLTLSYPSQG